MGEHDVLVTSERQQQAAELLRALPRDSETLTVSGTEGDRVELPAELTSAMRQILDVMAQGGTATVGAMPRELTTSAAAKELGISRPTLMKWINDGELPAHKVGTHTRLHTSDVLELRERQLQRRWEAFQELRALEDDES